MSNEEQKEETCTRCKIGTQYYIKLEFKMAAPPIIICNDCCKDFVKFGISIRMISPKDLIEYCTETRK
jgi:hypothetical protein